MTRLNGPQLKAAREKRGLSLEDAAHVTRIPKSSLLLLEQDNYAAFGSMTYARMFLKAYCVFLGLDAAMALAALPDSRPVRMSTSRRKAAFYGGWTQRKPRQSNRRPAAAHGGGWEMLRAVFLTTLLAAGLAGFWARHLAARSTPATTGQPPQPGRPEPALAEKLPR